MGRFIDITGAPIASDFQELPLDFMSKALEIQQKSQDTVDTATDEAAKLLTPEGGIRTAGEGKKVYEKYSPALEKIIKVTINNPQEGGRLLAKLKKDLSTDQGYLKIKADEAASKDVLKQNREFEAKGEIPAYRDLYSYTAEGPKVNKYTYEQLASGEVGTNPEDWYHYTAAQDVEKYVKDQSLDKLKADIAQEQGEDIVNLVEDGAGGLQAKTISGKIIKLDLTSPKVIQTFLNTGNELLRGNNPAAQYFNAAQPMGRYVGYEGYAKGIVPEGTDQRTANAVGFVSSLFAPYTQNSSDKSTTYNPTISAVDRAKLAEDAVTVVKGQITSDRKNNIQSITQPGVYSGIRADAELNRKNWENSLNTLRATYPEAAKLIENGFIKSFADLDKYKNSPLMQNANVIKGINDYFNNKTAYEQSKGALVDITAAHNNTVNRVYKTAVDNLMADKSISETQRKTLLTHLQDLKNQNYDKVDAFEGKDYFTELSNPHNLYDAGRYWQKGVASVKDGYEKDTREDITTYDIKPTTADKYVLESFANSVKSGELLITDKGKDVAFTSKYKDYYKTDMDTTHFKIDSKGNVYLPVTVQKTKDGPITHTEEVIKLVPNHNQNLEKMFIGLAKSNDITQQEAGIIGLTNIYFNDTGMDKKLKDLESYGKTTLTVKGESFPVERINKEYIVKNGGNTTKFTSLNALKLDLGKQLLLR